MRNESSVQTSIVRAIEYFFNSGDFGFQISWDDIRTMEPKSGAQAKHVEDFGRKPFDVAIYAKSTVVIFLEIKERLENGDIGEYKGHQKTMLETLFNNNVVVPFAYNSIPFTWTTRATAVQALTTTHVRYPKDMESPIKKNETPPAITLVDYLQAITGAWGSTHHNLAKLLDGNLEQMDNLTSMPIMILANLDPDNQKILIDKKPKQSLKDMKRFFLTDPADRQNVLLGLASSTRTVDKVDIASALFKLRDSWDKDKVMKPKGP